MSDQEDEREEEDDDDDAPLIQSIRPSSKLRSLKVSGDERGDTARAGTSVS